MGRPISSDNKQGSPRPRWPQGARGATMVEYLLMLLLGVLILLGALQIFGGGIMYELERATDYLATVADEEVRGGGERTGGDRSSEEARESASASADRESQPRASTTGGGGQNRDTGRRQKEEPSSGSVGGVNPLIIVLVILGILGSAYFIFGDDE